MKPTRQPHTDYFQGIIINTDAWYQRDAKQQTRLVGRLKRVVTRIQWSQHSSGPQPLSAKKQQKRDDNLAELLGRFKPHS